MMNSNQMYPGLSQHKQPSLYHQQIPMSQHPQQLQMQMHQEQPPMPMSLQQPGQPQQQQQQPSQQQPSQQQPPQRLPQQLHNPNRFIELLDQIRMEYENAAMSSATGPTQAGLTEEYQRKIEEQIAEMQMMERAMADLERKHNQMKEQYEAEIARLKGVPQDQLRYSSSNPNNLQPIHMPAFPANGPPRDGPGTGNRPGAGGLGAPDNIQLPFSQVHGTLQMPSVGTSKRMRGGLDNSNFQETQSKPAPQGLPAAQLFQGISTSSKIIDPGSNMNQPGLNPRAGGSVGGSRNIQVTNEKIPGVSGTVATSGTMMGTGTRKDTDISAKEDNNTGYGTTVVSNPALKSRSNNNGNTNTNMLMSMKNGSGANNNTMMDANKLIAQAPGSNAVQNQIVSSEDDYVVYQGRTSGGSVIDMNIKLQNSFQHDSVVCCVRYSWNGQYVATGSNRCAYVFDSATGGRFGTFAKDDGSEPDENGPDNFVRAVCFSSDGKWLITGAEDRVVKVWDMRNRTVRYRLVGHDTDIYSVDASADGQFIISGSGDKKAKLWSLQNGKLLQTLGDGDNAPTDGITSVNVSPTSQHVALGSLDKIVRVFEVETGRLVRSFEGHKDSVYSVAFSPDGRMLLSGSLDKTLKLWDLTSSHPGNQCRLSFSGHKDFVLSVAFSPNGRWLISGSKDRTVQFWDPRQSTMSLMLQGHKNSVISIAHSPTAKTLATGSGDCRARTWMYTT